MAFHPLKHTQIAEMFSMTLDASEPQEVEIEVHWELLQWVVQEHRDHADFSSVLTITGGPVDAYATTCQTYVGQ